MLLSRSLRWPSRTGCLTLNELNILPFVRFLHLCSMGSKNTYTVDAFCESAIVTLWVVLFAEDSGEEDVAIIAAFGW